MCIIFQTSRPDASHNELAIKFMEAVVNGLCIKYLTVASCFSMRISSYDARGKFGEHKRSVRVA